MVKLVGFGIRKYKMGNMTWFKKFTEWLVEEKEKNITTVDGKHIKVFSFNYDSSDNETMSAWAKHFRNHYCADEIIDILRRGTGLSRTDYLLNIKFPDESLAPDTLGAIGTNLPSIKASSVLW